jgi:hypothetical protein
MKNLFLLTLLLLASYKSKAQKIYSYELFPTGLAITQDTGKMFLFWLENPNKDSVDVVWQIRRSSNTIKDYGRIRMAIDVVDIVSKDSVTNLNSLNLILSGYGLTAKKINTDY